MSDRISTFLGAPPSKWKPTEIEQIKQIHRCYRNAFTAKSEDDDEVDVVDVSKDDNFTLNFGGNMAARTKQRQPQASSKTKKGGESGENDGSDDKNSGNGKKNDKDSDQKRDHDLLGDIEDKRDEEAYLPKDSPLRSKDGEKKAPLNPTFKDYDAFQRSCEFDFWREAFEQQSQDRFLAETAETIVANICNAQSRNELRVKHGNIPLRKKREHITPLALVLHDFKRWATNTLRPASIFEEDTYKDLRHRIHYVEGLSHKEVWGDPAMILAAGMRPEAHDKLFRLLLATKEALERAQEYAYRGYCRRSSREKLARLGNLLKNIVLREMRILSNVMTLNQKLSNPKTKRLQPTDLLNKIQNQAFVDYKNMVNVLMYRLCQEPLVRATLTSDYEGQDTVKALAELGSWTEKNLFCKPNNDGLNTEPDFLLDENKETKIMPKIYAPTAAELKKMIKEVDPRGNFPLSGKKHVKMMTAAFESEEAAGTVVKLVMKCAAAIQEVSPCIYAIHTLWGIAGDGGDFTVYDTLRQQVIDVMRNTMGRVFALQATSKTLLDEIGHLCKTKEKKMEERRLKTGKAKYKPAWVMNYKFLHTDLLQASTKGFKDSFGQLAEIARDAFYYNLTSDQLDDKVEAAKRMADALTGAAKAKEGAGPKAPLVEPGDIDSSKPKSFAEAMKQGKTKDWLHSTERSGDDAFGKNNAFDNNDFKFDDKKWDFEKEDDDENSKYNPFENGEDSDEY